MGVQGDDLNWVSEGDAKGGEGVGAVRSEGRGVVVNVEVRWR